MYLDTEGKQGKINASIFIGNKDMAKWLQNTYIKKSPFILEDK